MWVCAWAAIGFATTGHGHGIELELITGGHGIRAYFYKGDPIASAGVRVWAPGNDSEPFQEGWTDANGCFMFYPHTGGTWRIDIDDGMGHVARKVIEVSPDGVVSSRAPYRGSRVQGVITGLSVIFGLFGIYALRRRRGES